MKKQTLLAVLAALSVAACGNDHASSQKASTKSTAAAQSAALEAPPMRESKLASGVIDHTRDAKEFELRRSLWGVESRIEMYKASGYDTAELQAERTKLITELRALLM